MRNGRLKAHIEATYDVAVARITAFDEGTHRLELADGARWVARVFGPERPLKAAQADARVLRRLERGGFPAERCAHRDPVSVCDGHAVLVTGFVNGTRANGGGRTYAILGALLGRMHARAAEDLHPGGAWHHLATGTPADEVAAAAAMLDEAVADVGVRELALLDRLRDEVERTDDCHDLPHCFVHPDFVPANAIATPEDWRVIVDWTGAGRGPRLWSLGFTLWAAGAAHPKLIGSVVSRYTRHTQLEPPELEGLAAAIRARPLMLECWSVCRGRRTLADAVARVEDANRLAERIAVDARQAFAAGPR